MATSKTPRTDVHQEMMEVEDFDVELAKTYTLARQLERELNEALAMSDRLATCIRERDEWSHTMHPAEGQTERALAAALADYDTTRQPISSKVNDDS
jgi:hypothetical protein